MVKGKIGLAQPPLDPCPEMRAECKRGPGAPVLGQQWQRWIFPGLTFLTGAPDTWAPPRP